jgi:hypothetical protein
MLHVTVYPSPYSTISMAISGSTSICPGDSTILVAFPQGYTYSWSNGEIGDTINITQPGNYSVAINQPDTNAYGCTGFIHGGTFINITSYLQPLIYTIPSDGVVCPNDSVIVACLGPGTFVWQGPNGTVANPNNNYIYVTTPGNYYCIETFAPGCDLISNTVPVSLYSTPFIDAFPDAYICGNDSVLLTVVAGQTSTVQWLPPLTGNSFTQMVYSTGTYSCNVTSCGILTNLSFTVTSYTVTQPVITVQPPVLICTSPAITYQWYLNGNMITGATSQIYTPLQNGSYTVEIIDSNGCTALSLVYVLNDVGIEELSASGIVISPNPVKSILRINFNSENFIEGKTIVQISNMLGEKIISTIAHRKETISLENLSNGMYLVEVFTQDKSWKKKIVLAH